MYIYIKKICLCALCSAISLFPRFSLAHARYLPPTLSLAGACACYALLRLSPVVSCPPTLSICPFYLSPSLTWRLHPFPSPLPPPPISPESEIVQMQKLPTTSNKAPNDIE